MEKNVLECTEMTSEWTRTDLNQGKNGMMSGKNPYKKKKKKLNAEVLIFLWEVLLKHSNGKECPGMYRNDIGMDTDRFKSRKKWNDVTV